MMIIKKNRGIVFVLCLILLIPLFFVATANKPENKPLVKGAKILTTLNVDVFNSDGKLKANRVKEDDLLLDNFRNFWLAYFDSSQTKTQVLKDTSNTDRTFKIHVTSSSGTNTFCDSASGTANKGGYQCIGSGTTAPTQTNYNIETIYGSWTTVPNTYPTYDSATGIVVVQTSIAITGAITISESALAVQWIPSTGTTEYKIVMFRDTFAGISCVNGDTVVVTLSITLSASYNRNFGNMMALMFYNVADGIDKTGAVFYDTASNLRTAYMYSGSGSASLALTNYNLYAGMIGHGTGTTAESRTTNALTTQVDSYATISSSTISGSDLSIYGDILCGSNRALRENCIIVQTGTGTTGTFMFVRTLYNQVDIVSGHSARHTFTFDW